MNTTEKIPIVDDDAPVTVLLVDDDEAGRETLGKILRLKGFAVACAGSGREAIALLRERFYHLVVLDIRLPDASGLDLLADIRGLHEDVMVILATAYASIDSSIGAMNRGAFSYIIKPFNVDELLAVIGKALEQQRLSMENRRLLRELQEANRRLKELDRRKSDFVANVSHEFRNPLTHVKLLFDLLLDGTYGEINPRQRELLQRGERSVRRLIRLVTDLLDLAKIEFGAMQLQVQEIEVAPFVREIAASFEPEVMAKGIALDVEIQPEVGSIRGDADKLSEVLINLIGNAVKYTPDGGSVAVKCAGTDDELLLEIADSGPGIPPEYREKVFDKFERILIDKKEGTGLGLPIAREIVMLHRGRIRVEGAAGGGSRFLVALPRKG